MLSKLKTTHWILIGIGTIVTLTATGLALIYYYSEYIAPKESEEEVVEEEEPLADDLPEEELDCDTIVLSDDWQTYTNEDGFGYSIRYPSDWQLSEELFEGHSYWKIAFGPEGNISETASVLIGEANYHTLDGYRSLLSDGTSPPYILGESESVLVDMSDATRFFLELEGLEQFKYVLYFAPYEYISINRLFQGHTEESIRREDCDAEVFYTMLGSYMFGQEYENEECGFSFRYPISWEIESEYYYETAGGSEASSPTINLREFGDEETNEWITINPRQSDCYYVLSPEIEEEYVNGNKVTSYTNDSQGAKCIEAEVSAKDRDGDSTTFYWISFSTSEEIQEIFKQMIDTFTVY